MTEDARGDGYTLGLLVDLRDLCTKIGDNHYQMAAGLHDLLRKVANPNVHGLDKELTFRVQQTALGEFGETLRTISLNGNKEVAKAAFDAAVRCYPRERWLLLWGAARLRQVCRRAPAALPTLRRVRCRNRRRRAPWRQDPAWSRHTPPPA